MAFLDGGPARRRRACSATPTRTARRPRATTASSTRPRSRPGSPRSATWSSQLTGQRAEERIGETVEVLVEDRAPLDDGGAWEGRAAHQGPDVDGIVRLLPDRDATGSAGDAPAVGDLVLARVVGAEGVDLLAQRVPGRCPSGARAGGRPVTEPAAAVPPDPVAMPAAAGVSVWNVANALTFVRLLLVPVFAVLLLHDGGHQAVWRVAATVVFGVASLTDRLDGELARRRGLITDLGKIVDPIADKALIGTALVGLSWLDELSWWVTVVVLVREIGITVLRFVVIRHGVMPASRGGKVKTLLQAIAIGLYLLPLHGLLQVCSQVVMAAAVVVTVVTGVDYVARAMTLRRTSERAARKRAERAARVSGPGR